MSFIQYPIIYPYLIQGTPYEHAPPLPTTIRSDGKSLENPPSESLSPAYTEFPDPLDKRPGRAAFDVHIYYHEPNKKQKEFARSLWERIRYECMDICASIFDLCYSANKYPKNNVVPELRVYRFWEQPIGVSFPPPKKALD